MNIVSWNILHGGGKRAPGILLAIEKHQPDIVTLQEFRHGASKQPLLDGLADMGLREQFVPEVASARDNSLIIAARRDFQAMTFPAGHPPPARAIKVYFPDGGGLNLLAVHLPQKKKQPPFLHALLELDPYHLEEDSLLIGDFNCGIPFEDSETKTFEHTHLFQQLLRQGWIDAWRARNPDKREYSWFSTRLKNGYCYDHALFSPRLNQRVENVYYDHGVREAGLSDHSLLKVEIGE